MTIKNLMKKEDMLKTRAVKTYFFCSASFLSSQLFNLSASPTTCKTTQTQYPDVSIAEHCSNLKQIQENLMKRPSKSRCEKTPHLLCPLEAKVSSSPSPLQSAGSEKRKVNVINYDVFK
jgi:hypothetical protein